MGAESAATTLLEADGLIRLLLIGLHHVHPRLVLVHGVDNDLHTHTHGGGGVGGSVRSGNNGLSHWWYNVQPSDLPLCNHP